MPVFVSSTVQGLVGNGPDGEHVNAEPRPREA